MKISKEFALSNLRSLEKDSPRLFKDLLEEFGNMSGGGIGGPYRIGHKWTTVRKHYYATWADKDFKDVINDFENSKKKP